MNSGSCKYSVEVIIQKYQRKLLCLGQRENHIFCQMLDGTTEMLVDTATKPTTPTALDLHSGCQACLPPQERVQQAQLRTEQQMLLALPDDHLERGKPSSSKGGENTPALLPQCQ